MDDNCAKSAQLSSVDNPGRLRDHIQPVSAKRCACQGAFRGIKPCAKNAQDLFHDPLDSLPFAEKGLKVRCLYPAGDPVPFTVENNVLTVRYDAPVMARLFEITAE